MDIEISRKITSLDSTYMMSMNDLMAFGVRTPGINSGYFLGKEFIKLIHISP